MMHHVITMCQLNRLQLVSEHSMVKELLYVWNVSVMQTRSFPVEQKKKKQYILVDLNNCKEKLEEK